MEYVYNMYTSMLYIYIIIISYIYSDIGYNVFNVYIYSSYKFIQFKIMHGLHMCTTV